MQDDAASLSPGKIEELTAFLHDLADRAATVTLPYFRAALSVDDKSLDQPPDVFGYDPVTVADKAAEKAIREMIVARK